MPFRVSPGVTVTEHDLTTIVPAVATTDAAIAGTWKWGPVDTRVLVDNENTLVERFGEPSNLNAETFYTAANFLSYSRNLYVTRVVDAAALNSVSSNSSDTTGFLVRNQDHFDTLSTTGRRFIAKYPGDIGNSLSISVCENVTQFNAANISIGAITVGSNQTTTAIDYTDSNDDTTYQLIQAGDIVNIDGQLLEIEFIGIYTSGASLIRFTRPYTGTSDYAGGTVTRFWKYYNNVDKPPGESFYAQTRGETTEADEIHVVIADATGAFTGVPGTILEIWEGLSRATDAKTENGESNYYITVLNNLSQYIWAVGSGTLYDNTTINSISAASDVSNNYYEFENGTNSADEDTIDLGALAKGYDLYDDSSEIDVSLILQGKAIGGANATGLANYIIDNICEVRKDCMLFVSPDKDDVVNNPGDELVDVLAFRNSLSNTSYGVLDSGYKYQYDKYNDLYRWIPLNGDIAGVTARTDNSRDPWWSPAGFNRGNIKNIVKLAWNPSSRAFQDALFKSDVNPVISVQGQGTLLHGDKTLLGRPSGFNYINVRRLFIVLEKAISSAAKFTLFEFNDEFTRGQFRNLVDPYLRDIQGRRGIIDYKVVVDDTNNTSEVIDRGSFVGDIYIKASQSIKTIQLNFVAVRSGVEFKEIVGQF